MNTVDLSGYSAIVTGGGKGLGRAIAEKLLKSGASVMVWDLDSDLINQSVNSLSEFGVVFGDEVNVTDEDQVSRSVTNAIEKLGRVDILVNNAGVGGPNAEMTDISLDDWNSVFSVNATGTFLCCKHVVPVMKSSGYGRVVNIASANGKEGNPKTSPYSAAKAAVIAFTKSVAKEVAENNIIVNSVAPASIHTDFLLSRSKEHLDTVKSKIPLKRFAEPEEIAVMVAWLSSSQVSYTTGACFDLSGGRLTY